MSRHVHLPPLLPLIGPKPLEKKDKTKRKSAVAAERSDETAAPPPERMVVDAPPPPPPPAALHNPSPLGSSGGQLSVLLGAQEEAQPAETVPPRDPDEVL